MVRWLVIGFVVLAVAVGAGPAVLAQVPDARSKVSDLLERPEGKGQSRAQVSAAEFGRISRGMTDAQLRDLVGEPEAEQRARVEGVRIECLLYGIAGASGSYQFCFADGKLSSKLRFASRSAR